MHLYHCPNAHFLRSIREWSEVAVSTRCGINRTIAQSTNRQSVPDYQMFLYRECPLS